MVIEVLDPTYDESAAGFAPAPRLTPAATGDGVALPLSGLTVGVISNGKRGTRAFFDALDAELRDRYGAADVVRVVKPNYSAPAGDDIMDHARRWHAVVAGIGD